MKWTTTKVVSKESVLTCEKCGNSVFSIVKRVTYDESAADSTVEKTVTVSAVCTSCHDEYTMS